MPLAAIGLGGNLGDVRATFRAALEALREIGVPRARSSLYRTKAWGMTEQPDFLNAVVLLETSLSPRDLLAALRKTERRLGRQQGERWGPRAIDLDILTYADRRLSEPGLEVPHARLRERAFALAPLAEVEPRYRRLYEALPASERESVQLAGPPGTWSESERLMSDDQYQPEGALSPVAARVRALAEAFVQTDLVRLRIEEANADAVELCRHPKPVPIETPPAVGTDGEPLAPPLHLETIKADLVGIFHFSRPAPSEGDTLKGDRELAHVEALGIRNPVRSLGRGRIVSIKVHDGQPVEYGQILFELDRG
ncbi:MAG: 2-amino-4-hydroxy-6-hydroxymethyldihydropteridine diphosphokinase [Vulcanimicrobiaceae bacterium]